MAKLEDISVRELEEILVEIEGYREVERLLAAIIYKRGPSVPKIAQWLDKREATIYRWFDRLEAQPIDEAIRDDPRSGRPPKLTDKQRETFISLLHESPEEAGYDAATWTPKLVRQHLFEEFDIEYTLRHVRRLMRDSGLSLQSKGTYQD